MSNGTLPEGVEITERSLLALTPWALLGASVYVLFQIRVLSVPYGHLLQVPIAYLGTALLAGAVWLAAAVATRGPAGSTRDGTGSTDGDDRSTGGEAGVSTEAVVAGAGAVAATLGVGVALASAEGGLRLDWPLAGLAVSAAVTAAVWWALGRARPSVTERVGDLGPLAVFGHVLDGVLTAVGVDVFGFGEQTTLSRYVLRFAGELPTAPYLGTGWLFVLLKVVLVVGVVWYLADAVEEDPTTGLVLLAVVAAVGLGPGLHNTLLFVVAAPGG